MSRVEKVVRAEGLGTGTEQREEVENMGATGGEGHDEGGAPDPAATLEVEADEPITESSSFSFYLGNQALELLREQREHDVKPARPVKHNRSAYQHQQPDEVATELKYLDKLLTIDNNVKPSKTHLEEEFGARQVRRESEEGPVSSEPRNPNHENFQKPADRSLQHIRATGVEFVELSYTVVKKHKQEDGEEVTQKAHLLHSITGAASKGEITAVMGPSGAGKSTLLDALAGRIDSRSLGGYTMVDGRPVNATRMKRMSAYVMQDDQLFPRLTVWETLSFAAEIRLPRYMSRAEKLDRVAKLIDQLGLTRARNTYVGDEKTRGISGGEKRRVSIGVDIIHGPALLFMDEPTSGLDSTSAYSVIEKVHDMAKSGSTVIITIHQPSSRILQHLSRLIVLARGQLVYQGSPDYLSTHLARFGREVPRGENPTEYLLDVIQEYDKSPYGIDPLVVYNSDGTKFDTNSPSSSTPVSAHMQKQQLPGQRGRSIASDVQTGDAASKTPLESLSTAAEDERLETMETGDAPGGTILVHDDHGAFDHSISRSPKVLASLYYKGVLESLAGKFLSPRASPLRMVPPSPVYKTPGPTHASPMHNASPFGRINSRTPLRSDLTMSQENQNHCQASFEIGPATPGATPRLSEGSQGRPHESDSNHPSDYTVTERDFHILESQDTYMHGPKFANIWWREVLILMFRVLLNIKRSPELCLSRQTSLTVFALMSATLFLKTIHHTSDLTAVTSMMAFFTITLCLFYFTSMDSIPAIIMERLIYIRETSHNSYRASAYVMANAIVFVPVLAGQALSYVLITWWALGFGKMGAGAFWFFFLVLFVSLFCTGSFVMSVSAVVPNYILAYTLVVAVSALYLLFCGFFIHRNDIPVYWIWLHYLSPMKYTYEALVLNEFGDKKHQYCYFVDPDDSTNCLLTGKDLLNSLAINQLTKWDALTILSCMAVFYRFLFYCVLRFGSKNKRS